MLLEIGKKYVQEFYNGKLYAAVAQKDGVLWTDDRICKSFNFGNGTIKDLQRYINDNKKYAYFVEV